MDLTVIASGDEPVTLAAIKQHVRVDHEDEDDELGRVLAAARAEVEAFTRITLRQMTVRITADGWDGGIALPVWPVRSIVSVVYDDEAGVERTLAPADYTLVTTQRPALIMPAYQVTWPVARRHWGAVRVTAEVGLAAADIPADLIAALMIIAGRLYEHREDMVIGSIATALPLGARALMMRHVKAL